MILQRIIKKLSPGTMITALAILPQPSLAQGIDMICRLTEKETGESYTNELILDLDGGEVIVPREGDRDEMRHPIVHRSGDLAVIIHQYPHSPDNISVSILNVKSGLEWTLAVLGSKETRTYAGRCSRPLTGD